MGLEGGGDSSKGRWIDYSVLSGYFHFGNNHCFVELSFLKYILQVLTDGRYTHIK